MWLGMSSRSCWIFCQRNGISRSWNWMDRHFLFPLSSRMFLLLSSLTLRYDMKIRSVFSVLSLEKGSCVWIRQLWHALTIWRVMLYSAHSESGVGLNGPQDANTYQPFVTAGAIVSSWIMEEVDISGTLYLHTGLFLSYIVFLLIAGTATRLMGALSKGLCVCPFMQSIWSLNKFSLM